LGQTKHSTLDRQIIFTCKTVDRHKIGPRSSITEVPTGHAKGGQWSEGGFFIIVGGRNVLTQQKKRTNLGVGLRSRFEMWLVRTRENTNIARPTKLASDREIIRGIRLSEGARKVSGEPEMI